MLQINYLSNDGLSALETGILFFLCVQISRFNSEYKDLMLLSLYYYYYYYYYY